MPSRFRLLATTMAVAVLATIPSLIDARAGSAAGAAAAGICDAGADTAEPRPTWTPCARATWPAVEKLLAAGVAVDTPFRYNRTALSFAADRGHVEVVRVLLAKGADPNATDTFYNQTPLGWACAAGADAPARARRGREAAAREGREGTRARLGHAIGEDDVRMLQVILDAGGLPPALLSDSLAAAKKENKTEIVAALEKAGAEHAGGRDADGGAAGAATPAPTTTAGRTSCVALKDGALVATVRGNRSLTSSPRSETSVRRRIDPGTHRDVRRRRRARDQPHRGQPGRRAVRLQASRQMSPTQASVVCGPAATRPRAGAAAPAAAPRRPSSGRRSAVRRRPVWPTGTAAGGDHVERARPARACCGRRRSPGSPCRARSSGRRSRVRVDGGEQRSRTPTSAARALRRRRAGQGRVAARVAPDRARSRDRQGAVGQGGARGRAEDQASSQVEPGVADAGDGRHPRRRVVRLGRAVRLHGEGRPAVEAGPRRAQRRLVLRSRLRVGRRPARRSSGRTWSSCSATSSRTRSSRRSTSRPASRRGARTATRSRRGRRRRLSRCDGHTELVTQGTNAIRGYDPATGKELWRSAGNSEVTVPTPIAGPGTGHRHQRLPRRAADLRDQAGRAAATSRSRATRRRQRGDRLEHEARRPLHADAGRLRRPALRRAEQRRAGGLRRQDRRARSIRSGSAARAARSAPRRSPPTARSI